MPVALRVYVDWDNDGAYSGVGEEVTGRVLARAGLKTARGRDQLRSLAPPMAGSLSTQLDNRSRDYSPANSGGPLYGRLVPGRRVQVTATLNANPATVLWTGYLDDLPQRPAPTERAVDLPALGSLSRLRGKTISTGLYQDVRTDTAIGVVLDAVGWPAADRVLDTGRTTLGWWWLSQEDAFNALRALLNTEGPGAALYEDSQGRLVFESRHYRLLTARSTASQATFRDSGAEPLFSAPFSYQPGLKDVINRCSIEVVQRAVQAEGTIWSNSNTFTLAAGETRRFTSTGADPVLNAVTPVVPTDITLTGGSLASVTLDRTTGTQIRITLVAGGSGATVSRLALRAQPVARVGSSTVTESLDTSASQAAYGLQSYTQSLRAELDTNSAQDLANAIVARYQQPRPTASLSLAGSNDTRLAQQLGREVSDRVSLIEAQTGTTADLWIERIEHQVEGGTLLRTTLGGELLTTPDGQSVPTYFVLDRDTLNSPAVLGY